MPQNSLEPARALASGLGDTFGEKFLGLREDREEITYWVDRSVWQEAARYMRDSTTFNVLEDLNVVDYLDRNPRFDLAIMLMSLEPIGSVRLKTLIPDEQPEVDSLCSVWTGANWYEREMFDLFGVFFVGHPDQRRLLLPADYHGHPLRKDYPVTGPATSAYR